MLGLTRDQDRLFPSAACLSALPWRHRARPQGTLRSSPLRAARVDAGGSPATVAPGIRRKMLDTYSGSWLAAPKDVLVRGDAALQLGLSGEFLFDRIFLHGQPYRC